MTRMGARPTEGSSIRRILGAVIRARASVSICCSPPLMLPASCRRRSASRGKVSKQNARFCAIAARALGRYATSRRFSSTVSRGKSRRPSGTSAMPRSTICSGARPTRSCSTPSIVALMVPELGDTMPIMHFISVLLPLPLVPSRVTVSPSFTASEMRSSTCTAPYPAQRPSTRRLFSKVGPHDFGVSGHDSRVPVGDLASGDQNRDALGEFHHRAHHVLDHDHRDALLLETRQEREDVVHFRGGEPGHRLVGNKELRLRSNRPREPELSQVHLSQAARHRVRPCGEAHLPEDAHRLLDDAALGQLFVPARGIKERHAQVVEHRHAGERLGDLKAAREAEADALVRGMPADVLAVETDAPFLVPERSGDAVDERALSRAVGPDQADPLAGSHHEVDAVERGKTAKSLGHATHFEQRSGHQRSFRRRQASTQPMMPFGASVTKSTSSTPTIRRFQAEDTVTCTSCCTVPSRIAPISGPIQLIMPPISGMAMLLTAYDRLNAELGSMYER